MNDQQYTDADLIREWIVSLAGGAVLIFAGTVFTFLFVAMKGSL